MLKNIIFISTSMVFFFAGLIVYGVILNIREVTLSEAHHEKKMSKLNDVHLVVDRKNYRIELYSDKILVKTYKAAFGRNSSIMKTSVSEKGQVTIPKAIRDKLGLRPGTILDFTASRDRESWAWGDFPGDGFEEGT